MSPLNEKDKLRAELRAARRRLDLKISDARDKAITDKVIAEVDWTKVNSLHCYIAMKDWREINTWPILKYIWQNHPKILVAAPRILEHRQMAAVIITPKTKWGKHATGIPEPANGKVLQAGTQFDLIIVPTLGFDKKGYRLGSGSGHYDRFLAGQPKALKVGFCYQDGFLEKGFPHEPHDIKMDKIITEKQVFTF